MNVKTLAKRVFYLPAYVGKIAKHMWFSYLGMNVSFKARLGKIEVNGKYSSIFIDEYTFVGKVYFQTATKIEIGRFCVMNDGVKLISQSHNINSKQWELEDNAIVIEDYCWIATDAIILGGTRLGKGSVVGAGAVVKGVYKERTVLIGNPAIPKKIRDENLWNYNPVMGDPVCSAFMNKGGIK